MPSCRKTAAAILVITAALAVTPAAEATPRLIPATDRELVLTVEGTPTFGTLHVPAHRRGERLAAALLLSGSGTTDRNGDQLPAVSPHTMAHVADALGDDKVVTFRFDKYGSGRTGMGAFADHPETIDFPAFVRQAEAAYALLRAQPETDPRAMSLAGHSEGALTALVLAQRVLPRPKGLALVQPQAIRLLDLVAVQLHAQLAAAAQAGQLTPDQQRTIDTAVDQAVTAMRAHRQVDTADLPPALTQLFQALQGTNRRFVESDDALYPPDVAERLHPRTRVLLTCGTSDTQIPCDITTALAKALRGAHTTGPGRVVLPGVDHNLRDTDHPDQLAPTALRALHDFAAH